MRLHAGGGIVAQVRMDVDHPRSDELAAAIDPVVAIGGERGIADGNDLAVAEQDGAVVDPAAAAVVHGRADQRRRTAGIGGVGRGEGGIAILANRRGPILGRGRGHAVAPGGGTSGNRECGRAGEQGIFLHGTPNAVGPEHRCPGPCGQLHFVGAIKQFADWHRIADQPNGRVSGWIPAPCGSPGPSLWPSRSSPTSSS